MLDGYEPESFADKAYETAKNCQVFIDDGIADRIIIKRRVKRGNWGVKMTLISFRAGPGLDQFGAARGKKVDKST